jgi:hypothetical protein
MLTLLGPEAEVVLKEVAGVGGNVLPVHLLYLRDTLHDILDTTLVTWTVCCSAALAVHVITEVTPQQQV